MATIAHRPPSLSFKHGSPESERPLNALQVSESADKAFMPVRIFLGQDTYFGVIIDGASTGYSAGCSAFACSCAGCT